MLLTAYRMFKRNTVSKMRTNVLQKSKQKQESLVQIELHGKEGIIFLATVLHFGV